jgi:hypothetical protein
MKKDFMNMVLKSVKNLLGNKSTQTILRYIASVTIDFACKKFNIPIYKYDRLDMKNMMYHNGVNTGDMISPDESERIIDLFSLNRFVEGMNDKGIEDPLSLGEVVRGISNACSDETLLRTYDKLDDRNGILKLFDLDTLETSSIADNYEISSGGVYIPDRNIMVATDEGKLIADAKNEYLEKRMMLGNNVDKETLNKLLREYQDKIELNNVMNFYR